MSPNRYGFDIGNTGNDTRLVEEDYSIGGGVTMHRPWDRGFGEHKEPNFYGKGPKGWKRSDKSIYEEVCEALFHSSSVDASNIEVEVQEGCVYLRGSVDSRFTKREAERCVENLSGVEDVYNELQIA